jgi:hypothetical protein
MRLATAIVSLLTTIGLAFPTSAGPARFPATPSDLPLRFEENRGQGPAEALFVARGAEGAVALTRDGALVLLQGPGGAGPATLQLRILGAAGSLAPTAHDPLPGVSHYVHGRDPSRWITGVRSFGRVVYGGVYPGVDLVFYGHGRRLEHDFVVAAGADERAIRLGFEGADAISVEPTGDLAVRVGAATARFLRPVAFQEIRGLRRPVESAFELRGDGAVGFRVGAHDRRHPLVIDPVLDFATYLAGSEDDVAESASLDGNGGVYVAGATHSFDFPPVGGIPRLNSSGIFRREEGEDSWVPSWQGLDDPNVAALAVDPLAPDTVYAATLDAGFYRSGDGGRTWQPTNNGIWFSRYQSAYAVVADPQVAGVAFVGTEEGVFKTTDGGITWREANQGLDACNGSSRWIRTFLFHPSRRWCAWHEWLSGCQGCAEA